MEGEEEMEEDEEGVVVGFWSCNGGCLARGVCGGVVAGFERAKKSEGERPRGRVGGWVRWRLGVEGREGS